MFFCHGKTNSCGVLTAFYGLQNLSVNKTVSDNSGRILILNTKIMITCSYLLISIMQTLKKSRFKLLPLLLTYKKLEASGGNPKLKRLRLRN